MIARYTRTSKVIAVLYVTVVFTGITEGFYREIDHGLSSTLLMLLTLPFSLLAWIPSALRMAYLSREQMTLLMFAASGVLNAFIFLESVRFFRKKKKPNQPLQRNASTGSASSFESPARRD